MEDRYDFADILRGKSVQELQELHSQFLFAIVRSHGPLQTITIVGASLQLLATFCSGGCAVSTSCESDCHVSSSSIRRDTSAHTVAMRWRNAAKKCLGLPDPWKGFGLKHMPLERAQQSRWDPHTRSWRPFELLVRMEKQHFTRGAMRLCYRLQTQPNGINMVAKRYEKEAESASALEADVVMQRRAKDYASRFNACSPPKKIDVLEASMIRLTGRPEGMRDFAVETFLDGSFIKHSSNSGFVADEIVRHTPHAFSHFTFEVSSGDEIVVDIQGVDDLYTDPQIHTICGERYGRGDMGLRGAALFFSSHRCNSVCRHLELPNFAHSPMPGSDAAATQSRAVGMREDSSNLDDEIVLINTQALAPVCNSTISYRTRHITHDKYARVHFALAQLHAKHVQAGDDFIGHNVLASPAQGLFHLRTAAAKGSVSAMLTLACLQLQVRPRKGVMRALSSSLQQPLEKDEAAALPYIVHAAECGVTSAMVAAGYAYEHGCGCLRSATSAAHWYETAVKARGSGESLAEEDAEREGERLPGGNAAEHEIFEALAALYETGDHNFSPNSRLAWQFRSLGRSSARRDEEAEAESSE